MENEKPTSPPARGRGLKPLISHETGLIGYVAPRAGAWIETLSVSRCLTFDMCRPPRGGVD